MKKPESAPFAVNITCFYNGTFISNTCHIINIIQKTKKNISNKCHKQVPIKQTNIHCLYEVNPSAGFW